MSGSCCLDGFVGMNVTAVVQLHSQAGEAETPEDE